MLGGMEDTEVAAAIAEAADSQPAFGVGWHAAFAPDGWVRLTDGAGTVVFLHITKEPDGAPGTHLVVTASERPIRAATWRDVPFESVEQLAQVAGSGRLDGQHVPRTVKLLASMIGPIGPEETTPLVEDLESLFGPDAPTTFFLLPGNKVSSERLINLRRPEGRITDEFLIDLSAAYMELAASKRPPAPAIAEQTETPVRTVHRWIYEARKRGHLPPGRTGRAG
jgi:hypothetical protein